MELKKQQSGDSSVSPEVKPEDVERYEKAIDISMIRKGSTDKTLHRAVHIFPEFDAKEGFGNGKAKLRFNVERFIEVDLGGAKQKEVQSSFFMDCSKFMEEFVQAPA